MSDVLIREFRQDDFFRFRELYKMIKNRQRSEAFDRWSFFDTPWGDSIGVVAVDGTVCVSIFVLRPVMLDIGGEEVLGAQAIDLMTHPNYRKRGLFITLVKEAITLATLRGVELIYSFPNQNSCPGFVRRLNFDHVGDVAEWSYQSPRIRIPFVSDLLQKKQSLITERKGMSAGEHEALMAETAGQKGFCCIMRNQQWLQWRYSSACGERLEWYTARDLSGKVMAALLAGERDASWGALGQGQLMIHEVFGQSEDALVAVLGELKRQAVSTSKLLVKTFVKNPVIESALQQVGFKSTGKYPLIVRRLNTRLLRGNVHNFSDWRIMGGDF